MPALGSQGGIVGGRISDTSDSLHSGIVLPILLELFHRLTGAIDIIDGLQRHVIDVRTQEHILRRFERGVQRLYNVVLRNNTRYDTHSVGRLVCVQIGIAVIGVIAHFIHLILTRLDDDVIGVNGIACQIRAVVVTDEIPQPARTGGCTARQLFRPLRSAIYI